MADGRRRDRNGRRAADGSFLRATLISALLHAVAIVFILAAPHRMRAAPPAAYTVEIVDPNALGGKLLAGPIGGGAAARRPPPPKPPEPPPKPPEPPPPPREQPKPEPEQVAKAEPAKPEPKEDADAVPLGTATPPPQPTRIAVATPRTTVTPLPRASATPIVVAKPKPTVTILRVAAKPTASPLPHVVAKATASPVAVARRPVPTPVATPARGETREQARGEPSKERGAPPADLDSQLAAAIKGVESRVGKAGTPGLSGAGPGGGQGGTERTLNGPPGVGGEGPGGGGTLRGLEFVVYYNQMLTRIKESWAYVGDRADLRVTVRFSILDSGEITDIRLVERSNDPGYDASVMRAVKRASPLGPPPQAYRKDFADVELTFRPADLRRPSG